MYVYDGLFATTREDNAKQFPEAPGKTFGIAAKPLKHYPGPHVHVSEVRPKVRVDQSQYISDFNVNFIVVDCKHAMIRL